MSPVDPDADHGLAAEPQLQRVGDRDDLDDARVLQPVHALPYGGLGQAHGPGDGGVGAAPVLLQLLDDRLADIVEERVGDGGRHGPERRGRTVAREVRSVARPGQ